MIKQNAFHYCSQVTLLPCGYIAAALTGPLVTMDWTSGTTQQTTLHSDSLTTEESRMFILIEISTSRARCEK